jgi:hypothetical protein
MNQVQSALEAAPASRRRLDARERLLLLVPVLAALTVGAAIVSNGNVAMAVAPVAAVCLVTVLVKVPLRYSAFALMFAGLTFENPAEDSGCDLWKSPLYPLGKLLLDQLKQTIPVGALVMTGTDLVLLLLLGGYVYRRAKGLTIDMVGAVPTPRPLIAAALAYLGAVMLSLLWGAATGGDFRFILWQVQRNIYMPLMFLFMQTAFQGVQYRRSLGRLIVTAACVRSLMAIWVHHKFPEAPYGTTHADSMLFATGFCIVLITFMEARDRRSLLRCLAILPLLTWGMIANNRRLVWVEIGETMAFVVIFTRWTRFKIKLVRRILYAVPVIGIYCRVGWNSSSGIFKVASMLRTIVDSKTDSSTAWRDTENYNLASTFGHHPPLGSGYGHPFDMVVPTSEVYPLERYVPHNSILGLWAFLGYVGFSLVWMLLIVGIYFAIRTYRMAKDPTDRATALSAYAAIIIYVLHCYGDMGMGTWTSLYLVPTALTLSGKLAVTVGAWPPAASARSG